MFKIHTWHLFVLPHFRIFANSNHLLQQADQGIFVEWSKYKEKIWCDFTMKQKQLILNMMQCRTCLLP